MKVSANLNDFPSGFKFEEGGMAQLVKKTTNLGLFSIKPKKATITDRTTGEVIKLNMEEIKPITVEEIIKFDFLLPKDRAKKTFGCTMMDKKMELKATSGRNTDRYLVEYELELS